MFDPLCIGYLKMSIVKFGSEFAANNTSTESMYCKDWKCLEIFFLIISTVSGIEMVDSSSSSLSRNARISIN